MKKNIWAIASVALLSTGLLQAQAAPASAKADPAKASASAEQIWNIDVSHSELTFSIRHLISKVRGQFNSWKGTITLADPKNWETATVDVTIEAPSIDTNNERRDNHLRNSDFFEVDKYPTITFKSTSVKRDGDNVRINGNLTMKGVSKPVVLTGKFTGSMPGGRGKPRMGFEASTTINRMDYGVAWNRALEGGGTTLGDEVTINIAVAAIQQ